MEYRSDPSETPVDQEQLLRVLTARRGRIDESELLERFLPGEPTDTPLELFRRHFELYHALYSIQDRVPARGLKLHIGLARVELHELPPDRECRYFDSGFCRAPSGGDGYCDLHRDLMRRREEAGALGRASLKTYYLDRSNLETMDGTRLEMMMQGVYRYASSYDEVEDARRTLGLDRDFSIDRLRRRFRYLSKQEHPDSGGDSERFNRIQKAYRRLFWVRGAGATPDERA